VKILHLVDAFDHCDGCARHVYFLAREQKRAGNEVMVCAGKGTAFELLEREGIEWHAERAIAHAHRSAVGFWRGILRLRRLIQSWHPSVIHAHHYYCSAQAAVARFATPAKTVMTVHAKIAGRGLLPLASGDRIIAVSGATLDFIRDIEPSSAARSVRIPNSSGFLEPGNGTDDTRSFQRMLVSKEKKYLLLFIGRLVAEKGVWVLYDALEQIRGEFPLVCCVAGTGTLDRALASAAERRELPVVLMGEVQNIKPALDLADIVIQPSLNSEGMPMAILEAGLAGKAVIASRTDGIPEVVSDMETGLLVSPGRPEELANAIRLLLRDQVLRTRLGTNLKKSLASRNDVRAMGEAVAEVYRSALGGTDTSR